jgi:hypothetical protein
MLAYLAHFAIRCPASSLNALKSIAEKSGLSPSSHSLRAVLERRQNHIASSRMDVNGYDYDNWQENSMMKLREGLLGSQGKDLMDIDGGDWQAAVLLQVNNLLSR